MDKRYITLEQLKEIVREIERVYGKDAHVRIKREAPKGVMQLHNGDGGSVVEVS